MFKKLFSAIFGPSWKGVCRHKALYCATVVSSESSPHVPVQIARGTLAGVAHAEAMAKIDGKWKFIGMDGDMVTVKAVPLGFEVEKMLSLAEFMNDAVWSMKRS